MPISALKDLPQDKALAVLFRLAEIPPKHLGQFFTKIRRQECPDPELPGPCWIWTGALDTGGRSEYGKIKIAGRMKRTHRWIFDVLVRKLRVDEDAHHMCEESLCCNPFHIEAVPCEKHSKRGPPVNWDGMIGGEEIEAPF